jgi:hypothetical protein
LSEFNFLSKEYFKCKNEMKIDWTKSFDIIINEDGEFIDKDYDNGDDKTLYFEFNLSEKVQRVEIYINQDDNMNRYSKWEYRLFETVMDEGLKE